MELLNKLYNSGNSNKESETQHFRQGDILFTKIPDLNTAGYVQADSKVVAYGEMTGHNHSFSQDAQVLLYKKEGAIEPELLEVKEDSLLSHQEHQDFVIPKGLYKITKEVEYNPFQKALNQVRD